MEIEGGPELYFSPTYYSKGRFVSYWYQVCEVLGTDPDRVLEVGIGNGFVAAYLRNRGVEVVTLDVDARLHPDLTAPVNSIPLPDSSFGTVSCCEVLEHLPYEGFTDALAELRRVTSRYLLLSLPDSSSFVKLSLQLSGWAATHRLFSHPRLFNRGRTSGVEHYWEIGRSGYPLRRIKI